MSSATAFCPSLMNTERPPDCSASTRTSGAAALLPFRPHQPIFAVHQLTSRQTENFTSDTDGTRERAAGAGPHRQRPCVAQRRTGQESSDSIVSPRRRSSMRATVMLRFKRTTALSVLGALLCALAGCSLGPQDASGKQDGLQRHCLQKQQ